jgi:nitrogenase molybdenum-iron protein NifN
MNLNFTNEDKRTFTATRNACRLCAPLGASLAFRGIERCIPLIHGSQGCSTYIRRYIISHFREPMDVASSNFTEASAVFGGRQNLHLALNNIIRQYRPKVIGIASTCLSETIGDDVEMFLGEYRNRPEGDPLPPIIYASTPSYQGSHVEGYFTAVTSTVKSIAQKTSDRNRINIIPGFISSDDIRHLKEILYDMGVEATVFPDYSETMDGEVWNEYIKLSPGGTSVESILTMGSAVSTIQLGGIYQNESAAGYLEKKFKTENMIMGLPIGIDETDNFFSRIKKSTGKDIPYKYAKERGRLADSYIDAHKYVFGKRAVLAGDEDMVTGMAHLCMEIGIVPVLCATGSGSNSFKSTLRSMFTGLSERPLIISDSDYADILDQSRDLEPDLVIGPSKGYYVSRALGIPLVRTGFPVHDRIGGQRLLHLGYRGTQRIFDAIVNALLEHQQNASPVGYSYQ